VVIGRPAHRGPIKIAGCSGFDETTISPNLHSCKLTANKETGDIAFGWRCFHELLKASGRHNKCWLDGCGNIGKSHGVKKKD
jgi:hypothetical protein